MKIDYIFWLVVILLIGAALLRELRSTQRLREGVVWLYGFLIGVVAYLPAQLSFGANAGMVGWAAAVIVGIIAAPLNVAVDLTFPLWGNLVIHVGLLGLWAVVAMTASLYHGLVAVWLGRIYRRRPARALATGAAVLVFNLCLLLLRSNVIGPRMASSKAQAHRAVAATQVEKRPTLAVERTETATARFPLAHLQAVSPK